MKEKREFLKKSILFFGALKGRCLNRCLRGRYYKTIRQEDYLCFSVAYFFEIFIFKQDMGMYVIYQKLKMLISRLKMKISKNWLADNVFT